MTLHPNFALGCRPRLAMTIKIILGQTFLNTEHNRSDFMSQSEQGQSKHLFKSFVPNIGELNSVTDYAWLTEKIYLFRTYHEDYMGHKDYRVRNCRVNWTVNAKGTWGKLIGEGESVHIKIKPYIRFLDKDLFTIAVSVVINTSVELKDDQIVCIATLLKSSEGRKKLKVNVRRKNGKYFLTDSSMETLFTYLLEDLTRGIKVSTESLRSSEIYCGIHFNGFDVNEIDKRAVNGVLYNDNKWKHLKSELPPSDFGKYQNDYTRINANDYAIFTEKFDNARDDGTYVSWCIFRVYEQIKGELLRVGWYDNQYVNHTLEMRAANHQSKKFLQTLVKSTFYLSQLDKETLSLRRSAEKLHGGLTKIRAVLEKKLHYKEKVAQLNSIRSEYIAEANEWKPGVTKLFESMEKISFGAK